MDKKKLKIYIIVGLVVLVAGLLIYKYTRPYPGSAESDMPVEALYTIVINESKFSPAEILVPVGTQVVWLQRDSVPHEIVFKSQDISGSNTLDKMNEKFKVIFKEPGEYEYSCSIHPSMTGKIIVE